MLKKHFKIEDSKSNPWKYFNYQIIILIILLK
jgi:hypothetical protein